MNAPDSGLWIVDSHTPRSHDEDTPKVPTKIGQN